jgi:hypothetical protein
VGSMAGCWPGFQVEHPVPDDLHRLLGNGRKLAPQPVEIVAVEPARAPLEPAGIDEVRRPDLAHVHPQPGAPARDHACCPRVIEMDMREHDVTKVPESEPAVTERRFQRLEAAARAAVDERRLVAEQQIGRDDLRAAEVEEIEDRVVVS